MDKRTGIAYVIAAVIAYFAPAHAQVAPANYQGLWWAVPAGSESGWGINFAHQGDTIFASWFTYDLTGKGWWLVMTAPKTAPGVYSGTLYTTTGPAFNAVPFDPSQVMATQAGTGTLTFTDANIGTFTYTVNGVTQTKGITHEVFGMLPSCGTAIASLDSAFNYQDLWWASPAGSESGWGINLTHQGDTIFASWFTYDVDGTPMWLVVTAPKTQLAVYSGTLYRTTGPPFNSVPFSPSNVVSSAVGTATFTFSDGNNASFAYNVNGVSQTKSITREVFVNPGTACVPPGPIGRYRVNTRGLFSLFDRRGWPNGYYAGDVLHMFSEFDSALQDSLNVNDPGAQASPTVGAEVALQLDKMVAMGGNSIVFNLGAADPTYASGGFVPPVCNIGPSGGVQWPQPTSAELTNLVAFFNLVQSKGVRVHLFLNSTHMDDIPNSTIWLSAILNVVKNLPALDLITFGGDVHVHTNPDGTSSCGIPAEPALWLGPDAYAAQYVKWAIGLAMSLGIPARQLSAEAIVGNYYVDQAAYPTIATLKQIFDALGIPNEQRSYALSFYEHTKCLNMNGINLPCSPDEDPHMWADQTLQQIYATIGQGNGARVIAVEMGDTYPITSAWPAQYAMESLAYLMEKYGVEGGDYWIWAETDSNTEADPGRAGEPVKLRGVNFSYNPVQKEILDAYGFHLAFIPNGSFELGGTMADNWTATGAGTVVRYYLAGEAGQPVVPSRGDYDLRLTTGSGANDSVSVTSETIQVTPGTTYTTTSNMRFQWSGDPAVGTPSATRPQVYVSVHYLVTAGTPSAIRAEDTLRFFQEDAPTGFGTFPISYSTPSDANLVQLEFGAARNGLPQPITLDVDNVR